MEKRSYPDESPRIEALKQRAKQVRADAVIGLLELDKLEAELAEIRRKGGVKNESF